MTTSQNKIMFVRDDGKIFSENDDGTFSMEGTNMSPPYKWSRYVMTALAQQGKFTEKVDDREPETIEILDAYDQRLNVGDKVVWLARAGTHDHNMKKAEIVEISEDKRGPYVTIEVDNNHILCYKVYNTYFSILKMAPKYVTDFSMLQDACREFTAKDHDITVYDKMSHGGAAIIANMGRMWLRAWAKVLKFDLEET